MVLGMYVWLLLAKPLFNDIVVLHINFANIKWIDNNNKNNDNIFNNKKNLFPYWIIANHFAYYLHGTEPL